MLFRKLLLGVFIGEGYLSSYATLSENDHDHTRFIAGQELCNHSICKFSVYYNRFSVMFSVEVICVTHQRIVLFPFLIPLSAFLQCFRCIYSLLTFYNYLFQLLYFDQTHH